MRSGEGATDAEFAALVARLSPRLGGVALLLTGDVHDAQDLLQTTWAKVYAAWPRVARMEERDAYVRRILAHAAVDRGRLRSRRPREVDLDPGLFELDARSDLGSTAAERDEVRRLLALLPPQQRAVLVLRYLLDLSEGATADLLGVSVGTVKGYASRGLATLRHLDLEGTP